MDKNKMKKGFTVGIASALLASQMVMMTSHAKAESGVQYTKINLSQKKTERTKLNSGNEYKQNQKVRVIVELEGAPAISYAQDKGVMYKELNASTRTKLQNSIKDEQKGFLADVKQEKVNLKVENSFTTVLNGVSGEVKYGDIEKLEKMPGVESVSIATEYERPKEKPTMVTSKEMVEAQQTWKDGYNGKGMVVGIIDTGIDYHHKDMKLTSTNGEKLSKSSTGDIISKNSLPGKFYTDKVPYGYNYADKNDEVLDLGPDASMHGMHVGGTVAANGDESKGGIQGVAPEAQLLALKVFGNDPAMPSTFGDIYIKAIDDGIKLGADVLNMSLGSTAGFVDDNNLEQKAVDNAVNNGIVMSISAGNSDNLSGEFGGQPLASNPDIGLVGAPSVSKSSLSVASIENNKISLDVFEIKVGNETLTVPYKKQSSPNPLDVFDKNEVETVLVGDGSEGQYKGKDVKGKIVVAERVASNPNYGEIQAEAEKAGAAGVIVKGLAAHGDYVSMALNAPTIPLVSLAQSEGNNLIAKLKEAGGTGKVTFTGEQKSVVNTSAGKMSSFTSWGVTPSLEMKPEITAPGGQIYSTLNNNKYGLMSGTSMAAPHVSGGSALVLQRVHELFPALKNAERSKMAKLLLMNTAKPVEDPDNGGIYYSPRRQGSGIMQLHSAVTTPAYVVNKGTNEGKVELKEINGDSFTFTLTAKNMSDEAIAYDVNTSVLTDAVNGGTLSLKEQNIAKASVTVDTPHVELKGKESKDITIKVDLKNADEELAKLMKNGYFVEGYVSLENKTDQAAPTLTVPFVGFKGDWNKAPILDEMAYDEDSYLGSSFMVDEEGEVLGENLKTKKLDADKIAFSPNGDKSSDEIAPAITFLRNSKSVEYSIVDENGKTLRTLAKTGLQTKNYQAKQPYVYNPDKTTWDGFIKNKKAEDGTYFYQIKTQLDYTGKEPQTVKIPVIVDTVKPVISNASVSEKKGNLKFEATDMKGSGLQYIEIFVDGKSKGQFDPAGKTAFDVPLENLKASTRVEVVAVDYANNMEKVTIGHEEDKTIPFIVTTSPEALGVFDDHKVSVKGYVDDVSGVKTLKVKGDKLVGGEMDIPTVYNEKTKQYEFNTKIAFTKDGVNDVIFTGEDNAGNKVEFKRQLIVDTTPATIEISGVPKGNVVGEKVSSVTLKVKVSDNFDDLRLTVDGDEVYAHQFDEPYEMRSLTHELKVPVKLVSGENKIVFKATDIAGHVTKEEVVINKAGNKDTTAPVPPKVNAFSNKDTVLKGKTEANATVVVYKSSKEIATKKANAKGEFTIKLPKQKAGTVLMVKAFDKAGNRSKAAKVKVLDKTAPSRPTVTKSITTKTTVVTGKAEAGSTVYIKANGSIIGKAVADKHGKYSVKIKKQKLNTTLSIYAKDKAKNTSKTLKVKVKK